MRPQDGEDHITLYLPNARTILAALAAAEQSHVKCPVCGEGFFMAGEMDRAADFAKQAIAAEREACAKLCDGWCEAHEEAWELGPGHSPCCHAKDCAAAIRSRGKEAGDA